MDNVRVWEESGRRVAVYEGEEMLRRDDLYLYPARTGDASACGSQIDGTWEFPDNGYQSGHRSRLLDNLVLAVRPFVLYNCNKTSLEMPLNVSTRCNRTAPPFQTALCGLPTSLTCYAFFCFRIEPMISPMSSLTTTGRSLSPISLGGNEASVYKTRMNFLVNTHKIAEVSGVLGTFSKLPTSRPFSTSAIKGQYRANANNFQSRDATNCESCRSSLLTHSPSLLSLGQSLD